MKSKQQDICIFVEKLVGVVSAVSVLLFLLRFSPLCKFVVPACYVCDILFVMLLFFRLKLYGAVEYLGTWQNLVDLLSAVPVVVLFARYSKLFQFITPLNSFCLFRLLNIIQLTKHSALAKKHFQHICFIVILIETAAILGANVLFRSFFNAPLIERYIAEYERFPSNPEYLMKDDENVILVYKNGTIQSRKGFIRDKKTHFAISNSSIEYLIRIKFSKDNVVSDGKINAPKCGIIVKSPELLATFNWLMLLLLLPAIIMFVVILWRDILSKDAKRIDVAAGAMKSGNFSAFDEELKAIEQGNKDEIAHLYAGLNNLRRRFPEILEKQPEATTELAETIEPVEAAPAIEAAPLAAAELTEPAERTASVATIESVAPEPMEAELELEPEAAPTEAVEEAETIEEVGAVAEIKPEPIENTEALALANPAESVEEVPMLETEAFEAAAPADDEAETAEAVAELTEPVELAGAVEAESELEPEAVSIEAVEEAAPVVEAFSDEAEPVDEVETIAEIESETTEPAEEATPVAVHEPHHSGGLLAAALKKQQQHTD